MAEVESVPVVRGTYEETPRMFHKEDYYACKEDFEGEEESSCEEEGNCEEEEVSSSSSVSVSVKAIH